MFSDYLLEPEVVYEDFHDGYLDGDENRRVYRITNPSKRELSSKLLEFFTRAFHVFIYRSGLVNEKNFEIKRYSGDVDVPTCINECLSEYIRYCIYFIMKMFKRRELRALGVLFISKNTNKRKGSYEINLRKPSDKFVRVFGVHRSNENLKKKGLAEFVKKCLEPGMRNIYQAKVPMIKRGNGEEILIKCYVKRRRGRKYVSNPSCHIDDQLLKIKKKNRQKKKTATLPLLHQYCPPIRSSYIDMSIVFKEFDNIPATI
uniref:HORMA domain-containing protein n=1 Tax=Strongyloides venezuelensis TaxID=75913 RepID=A0A0K0EYU6_STRVS